MSKVKYYVPAACWILMITILSLIPTNSLKKFSVDIISFDKLAHIFIYSVLSFLIAWGLQKTIKRKNLTLKTLGFIFVISIFYGIGMEIGQKLLSTGRYFEYYDIIANIIGSFIGLLFFIRKKQ